MRTPPASPLLLSTPQQLVARLTPLVGQPFPLTFKTRTDGSRLRHRVAKFLTTVDLPRPALVGSFMIVPPRGKGVPRLLREFVDSYIVTSGDTYNLQVWNRNPASPSVQISYASGEELLANDVRFVLCRVDVAARQIRAVIVATAGYIESHFGRFGRPTVKQQLMISPLKRAAICATGDHVSFAPDDDSIPAHRLAIGRPSGGTSIHAPPDAVVPLSMLREIVCDRIIGRLIPPGPAKNRGQQLERMMAAELGYGTSERDTLGGGYPDFRHQALEVKVQDAATVDLGRYSPQFLEDVPNCPGFTTRAVRYLIALTDPASGLCNGAVLCPGGRLGESFTYVADKSFKCQRTIPMSFFDRFDGRCVFNPSHLIRP